MAVCILLLLAGSIPAQLPAKLFSNATSPSRMNAAFRRNAPSEYSAAKCNSLASVLSILAAPCNGVSVTSVVFNAATRTVESGTTNTVGVVYRYPTIGTAPDGTVLDALVTIVSYTNNQDANQTNYRDADVAAVTAGFDDNLQPALQQESGTFLTSTPWNGSMNYLIRFVVTGTSTPRVITIAATSIDNDGSTACGGLRESVTYSAGFNQILTAAVTNQTVAGNTVMGPLTTQAGIGVGNDFANSALFVNVSQFNWTYSFASTGNCVAGNASENRFGSLNLSCQINFGRNFASVTLAGNVFNDTNGLTDSTVSGTGTNAGGLFANLLDGNGNVVSSVAVAANGTYTFPVALTGTYNIQISTVQGVESSAAPAQTLPAGWVNTGENLGVLAGNDGIINGRLPVTVGAVAITDANFGIEQRPVSNNNTAATQTNPGGTVNLTVPATTFTATDTAPGTVSSIRITAFPTNVTTVIINGTTYTAASFPPGGVTVLTNAAGNPIQPILFDPVNGGVNVDISYVAIDNAGVESSITAIARVPVRAGTTAGNATVGGRVLNDQARGAAHTIVLMIDQMGNVRSAITNPFGYFRFAEVEVGETYVIYVRHKRFSYQPQTVSLTDDLTDLDFVPQQ